MFGMQQYGPAASSLFRNLSAGPMRGLLSSPQVMQSAMAHASATAPEAERKGFFGSMWDGLKTPEGLQTLGATLRDIGSGGQAGALDALTERQQEQAIQQEERDRRKEVDRLLLDLPPEQRLGAMLAPGQWAQSALAPLITRAGDVGRRADGSVVFANPQATEIGDNTAVIDPLTAQTTIGERRPMTYSEENQGRATDANIDYQQGQLGLSREQLELERQQFEEDTRRWGQDYALRAQALRMQQSSGSGGGGGAVGGGLPSGFVLD